MKKLSLKRVLLNVILAAFIGFVAMTFTDVKVGVIVAALVFAIGTGLQIVLGENIASGSLKFALQTEVWVADIMENLFYENEFLNLAVDHSAYIQNKTVHVPQAGGASAVVKNRTELEATLSKRTDTELTYDLDNYTTDPVVVKDIEGLQVSYDKRQSVIGLHIATLSDTIAVETLQKWAVTGSTDHVLRTTGAATGMIPNATATGTRLLLTQNDIARAAAIMDIDKVPRQGRFAVIPTAMLTGLFADNELLKLRALVSEDMVKMGVIAELHGFKIISRGAVVRYTNAGANNIRTAASADAATDCAGAVLFSRFMVSQALGEIKVYANEGQARSYGDIFSAEVNHGANFLRPNNIGRVSIAQGYVAPV
jgi:hypothetical protein